MLVADPDPNICATYKGWLTPDFEVHEAADGREALVRIYALHPQVLVADVHLPYIDGAQLCTLLGEDTAPVVRCVVTTTDPSPEHARILRDCGAEAVLVRPVGSAALLEAITAGGRGARDAAAPQASAPRPRAQAKVRQRERYVSTTPPDAPPHLRCPSCDSMLQYDRSHVGGVSDRHPEQWDYYVCARHGVFQYRHRTRRLKPIP